MKVLSYFPPTTEEQAAKKLGKDIKYVKKLKKDGVLDWSGKLVCNISLDEFIKGGSGYHNALSLNLQKKIDLKIKEYIKNPKPTSEEIISKQLINLHSKGYLEIVYKGNKMNKPTNIFAIKEVKWTEKVFINTKSAFEKIDDVLISKLAYEHGARYCDVSQRYRELQSAFISSIKQFGFVSIFKDLIQNHLEKLQEKQKKIQLELEQVKKDDHEKILSIKKLKSDLSCALFSIEQNILPEMAEKRKLECEAKLETLKNNNPEFAQLEFFANKLNIDNEISLWNRFINKLDSHNAHGFNDVPNEFSNRLDFANNGILSKEEILEVVNHTRYLYKKDGITDFNLAKKELSNCISWNSAL